MKILGVLAVVVVLAGCLFLSLFADEGAMPPKSRIPAVPAGATVVEETKLCGSGGCWWSVTVEPAAGQTPEELAQQMGVASERTEPATVTDWRSVTVGSTIRDGLVVVHVGY
ncbi:hypothetical protein ACTI_75570 [Actinoplanes sp. OR16]|uniref:hypothetical protein n=1 Tax=Actinoplanes sp. OR16 TaxID=946334 RepID=UPI000F6C5DC7|nr:hypothetical protein [Actinoplanes sp. OR16]BBH70872.1 hypothetical protein ACTI_75570 [Actinoplanes sp. OR16]